jgi:hypothetical protein
MSICSTSPKPLAITIKTTGDVLGIGLTKTWELVKEGKLETIAIGTRRLVLFASIERLVEELRVTQSARQLGAGTQKATQASLAARRLRPRRRQTAADEDQNCPTLRVYEHPKMRTGDENW